MQGAVSAFWSYPCGLCLSLARLQAASSLPCSVFLCIMVSRRWGSVLERLGKDLMSNALLGRVQWVLGSDCLTPRKGSTVWSLSLGLSLGLCLGLSCCWYSWLLSLPSHTVLVEPDVQQVPKAQTYADTATWAGCQPTFAFL